MADQQAAQEGAAMVTILEAFAAFALVAGILIALADTKAYPLALGIVTIGGLYYLLGHPSVATSFGHLVNRAGQISSGSSAPG